MENRREYYFMKNDNWYFDDINDGILKLNNDAPEKAIISYERYLKDIEHDNAVMLGLISDEEDDAYEELREKEQQEEDGWLSEELEEKNAKGLFGIQPWKTV